MNNVTLNDDFFTAYGRDYITPDYNAWDSVDKPQLLNNVLTSNIPYSPITPKIVRKKRVRAGVKTKNKANYQRYGI